MNIRPATCKDGIEVVRLASAFSSPSISPSELAPHFDSLLKSDGHRVWVAETDGVIVGWLHAFLALRVGVPPFIEIGGLVVMDSYRRGGVGRKLVQEPAAWAGSEGLVLRVRCNCEREATHAFYQAFGFELRKQQHVFELNM